MPDRSAVDGRAAEDILSDNRVIQLAAVAIQAMVHEHERPTDGEPEVSMRLMLDALAAAAGMLIEYDPEMRLPRELRLAGEAQGTLTHGMLKVFRMMTDTSGQHPLETIGASAAASKH
jgi:hypothetical protein